MKILLFLNSLAGGGTERVAATLANHWAQRRWDVTVATLAPESEDFYTLAPPVRRVALELAADSGGVLDAAFRNLRRVSALRRLLRELRPGVAMAMMSTPNVLLALAGRGIPGLRTVGSEHCYPPHAPLGRLWTAMRRRCYGRLSAVVALTREGAGWIEANTAARCVPVIPNPVSWPLPAVPPRVAPELVVRPQRRILLAVGRLNPVKNFGALVDAFAQLAPRHPDWDLVILGEGAERASVEAAVAARELGGRVFLPGLAGNVAEWHARASLFVLCSASEGFPVALAEALCNGLPAVSSDCDTGPRDIIRHGIDGLLAAPGDPAALAAALDRLMGDDALRSEFAANAVDARQRFGIERVAAMWETLFKDLAGARLPSSHAGGAPVGRRAGP